VIGWHMPHQWGAPGPGIEPFTAIRRGRYKLIYFHAGPRLELYDLEVDVGEADDLAGRRPELLAEMSAEMDAYIERTGAALSVAKTSGEAAPMPSDVAAQMGDRTEREDP
jgi:arylsulfatase A-like enzyme